MISKIVLLIDHTKRFTESVVDHLLNRGYNVFTAQNKEEGYRLYRTALPDIVLIHEDLPEIDLARVIHILHAKERRISVMLIVSDLLEANAISAYYRNVNDCVAANICPSLLLLRIQRCLAILAPEKLKIPLGSSLFLPEVSQILCQNDFLIDLLPQESKLLLLLSDNQGGMCLKEDIIHALWSKKYLEKGLHPSQWQMNLDSLMYSLKKKLKNLKDIRIETIKRIGYRLNVVDETIRTISE